MDCIVCGASPCRCERGACSFVGCDNTNTQYSQACPSCGSVYHDKCLRVCKWCDFAVGWTCACGRRAFDLRTRRWVDVDKINPLFASVVACPHDVGDTETVFVLRERRRIFWRALLTVLAAVCYVYGTGFFMIGDQCAVDPRPAWCLPVVTLLSIGGSIPWLYYFYVWKIGIRRRWAAQQSRLLKNI